MIEECKDISECENKLSSVISKINLLGEIPLSTEEADKLTSFIKEQFYDNLPLEIEFLKTKTPTCLATFLVWKGILDYRDGDYWSGFGEFSILSDPNQQAKWGIFFIGFLKTNGLQSFNNIKDAHRYVTPILMHGMIPNSCLDEYFEKILLKMKKYELADPGDSREIAFLLNDRREKDKERLGTIKEIRKFRDEKKSISDKLKRKRAIVEIWEDVNNLDELNEKAGNTDELDLLPENFLEYEKQKKITIQGIQSKIEKLYNKLKVCEQQREIFSATNNKILDNTDDINQFINMLPGLEKESVSITRLRAQEKELSEQIKTDGGLLFGTFWNDNYILIINELNLNILQDKIEVLNSIRAKKIGKAEFLSKVRMIIKSWLNHLFPRFKKKEKTLREIQIEISEILKDLPVKNNLIEMPNAEFVRFLSQLRDNYNRLGKLIKTRQFKEQKINDRLIEIKKTAQNLDIDITGSIASINAAMKVKLCEAQENKKTAIQAKQDIEKIKNEIRQLSSQKQFIVKEIEEIAARLIVLGNGDFKSGVEQLKKRRDAHFEAQLLHHDLMGKYSDFNGLKREKDEAQSGGKGVSDFNSEIDSIDSDLKQINEQVSGLKVKLKKMVLPYSDVDKPVRRFLLYGGDTAEKFLVQSVQMLTRSFASHGPAYDELILPERVISGFRHWWKQYSKINEDKDEIVSSEDLNRFRRPMIYFEPALSEVKIKFSSQRIAGNFNGVCLAINAYKPDSYKVQLKSMKFNDDLIETKKIDTPLLFPADSYEFNLKKDGNTIRIWNIQGISPDHPFMAFNHSSKKLIEEAELPNEKLLILFLNTSHIESSRKSDQIVIEEAPLYGKWKEYKYQSLDLSDVKHLYLVDQEGKKTPIPISSEKTFEAGLCGGQILSGCHSEDRDIYIGEPPNICIPIENDEEIKGWMISIPKNSDSTLIESKHYRLSDLEEISIIDRDDGLIKIPLSDEKCIGKNPVGRFMVQLRNDVRRIREKFVFCIVPDLQLAFDKKIYLPCKKDNARVFLTIDVPEKMEFEPQGAVDIIACKDSSYRLETSYSEQSIQGILRYISVKGDSIPIPISIEIPRLTWRLNSMPDNEYSTEADRIEELWFGDLNKSMEPVFVIVKMPSFINDYQGRLCLVDTDQVAVEKIQHGKVRFDLSGFSDTLKAGEKSVHIFQLTVDNAKLPMENVELFEVRTKWEVEKLECVQEFSEEKINLKITWEKEHGKFEGKRVVKLWDIKSPKLTPRRWKIPENSYGIMIEEEKDKLPPGTYKLHIDIDDPWSSSEPIFPIEDSPNIRDIEIEDEVLHAKITITEVRDIKTNKIYKIESKYIIQTKGKIIGGNLPEAIRDNPDVLVKEVINNGWYLGEIAVKRRPPFLTGIDAVNPVKFEYISTNHFIESIEDKDGDGVYFCARCKELFWSQKCYEQEKKNGHKEYILSENFKMKFKLIT